MNLDQNNNNESNVNGIPIGVVPIWIWRRAIQESDIKSGTKSLLYTIANDLTDTGKYSQIDINDLARMAGLQKRSAEDHILRAKKAGLLETSIRRNSLGHPIGRKWIPAFPSNFKLTDESLNAENATRDESLNAENANRDESLNANFAIWGESLNAENASLNAKSAIIYKDTFPNTFSHTTLGAREDECFTEAFHAEDEKSTEKAVKPDISYKDLLAKLYEAAGDAVADEARFPGLACLSDVHRWLESGCDLEVDILPTIRARSLGRRRWSIRSWSYFTDAVADAKARRLSPMPEGNGGSNNGNSYYGYKSSGAEYDAMMERLYAYQDELLAKEDDNGKRNQELYRSTAE